jgi:hypothetical protein
MKSAYTLIAIHQKATCTLEMLENARKRTEQLKEHLKLWRDRHHMQWVHNNYRNEQDIIDNIITANRVYCRIKRYYLNLLTSLS